MNKKIYLPKIRVLKSILLIIAFLFIQNYVIAAPPQKENEVTKDEEIQNQTIPNKEKITNKKFKITPYGGFSFKGGFDLNRNPHIGYSTDYFMDTKFYLGTKSSFDLSWFHKPLIADVSLGIKLKNLGTKFELNPYVRNGYLSLCSLKIGYDGSIINSDEGVFQISSTRSYLPWLKNAISIESSQNKYLIKEKGKSYENFKDVKIKGAGCIAIADKITFTTKYYETSVGGLYKHLYYYTNPKAKRKNEPLGLALWDHKFVMIKGILSANLNFKLGKSCGRYYSYDREMITNTEKDNAIISKNEDGKSYIESINTLWTYQVFYDIKYYVIPKRFSISPYFVLNSCGAKFSKIWSKHNKNLNFIENKSNGWKKNMELGVKMMYDLCNVEKRFRIGYDISSALSKEQFFKAQVIMSLNMI